MGLKIARGTNHNVNKSRAYMWLSKTHMPKDPADNRKAEFAQRSVDLAEEEYKKAEKSVIGKCRAHQNAHMARYNKILMDAYSAKGVTGVAGN